MLKIRASYGQVGLDNWEMTGIRITSDVLPI